MWRQQRSCHVGELGKFLLLCKGCGGLSGPSKVACSPCILSPSSNIHHTTHSDTTHSDTHTLTPHTVHTTSHPQVLDGEEFNTVAAGEDVGVTVTFRNPLAIKLPLSRVRLHVQFTPAATAVSDSSSKGQTAAGAGGGSGGGAVAGVGAAPAAAGGGASGGGGGNNSGGGSNNSSGSNSQTVVVSPEDVLVMESQFSLHPGE